MSNETTNLIAAYQAAVQNLSAAGADKDHLRAIMAMALSDVGRGPDVVWRLEGEAIASPSASASSATSDARKCVDCGAPIRGRLPKDPEMAKRCVKHRKAYKASKASAIRVEVPSAAIRESSSPSKASSKGSSKAPKVWRFRLIPAVVHGQNEIKVEPTQNLGKRWSSFKKKLEKVCGESFRYMPVSEVGPGNNGLYMKPDVDRAAALAAAQEWANFFKNGETAVFEE